MRASTSVLALASLAVVRGSLDKRADTSNADDSTGVTLYVSSPACDYYQCHVDWQYGETVAVNWLNPPSKGGNVSVQLASNIGGPTYDIVDSFPSTTSDCDAGSGVGVAVSGVKCGRLEFEVPSGWKQMVNYTIVVQSLIDGDAVGYTDNVDIIAANTSAQSAAAPAGTAVTLVTGDEAAAASSSAAKTTATTTSAAASTAATSSVKSTTVPPITASTTSAAKSDSVTSVTSATSAVTSSSLTSASGTAAASASASAKASSASKKATSSLIAAKGAFVIAALIAGVAVLL